MKRLFLPASLAVMLALFAACEESTHRPPPRKGGWHPTEPPTGENPKPDPGEEPEKPEKPEKPDEPKVNPVPEQPKLVGEIPYGRPVPGKPGFVFSPSDQFKYIDVRGYSPGTPVTDPYSGKTFLVP